MRFVVGAFLHRGIRRTEGQVPHTRYGPERRAIPEIPDDLSGTAQRVPCSGGTDFRIGEGGFGFVAPYAFFLVLKLSVWIGRKLYVCSVPISNGGTSSNT